MRVREIARLSSQKLKGNHTAAASYTFMMLLCYTGILIAGQVATIFEDTLFRRESTAVIGPASLLGTMVTILLTVCFFLPLQLGGKIWYLSLNGEFRPMRLIFFGFSSWGKFCKTIGFTLVRYSAVFLCYLVPLIPAVMVAAGLRLAGRTWEASGGLLMLLLGMLAVLGLALGIYLGMGCFYADYLFAFGVEQNPFRAIRRSWRLASGTRLRLFRLLLLMLPYALTCLLIAPIPLSYPRIQCALAVYAGDTIEQAGGLGERNT